jgi:CHAT domain-containing protein/tetratricopeptide (TPR) repeat protein
MRRILAFLAFGVFVVAAPTWPAPPTFAQQRQDDAELQRRADAFVRLWQKLEKTQSPEERVAWSEEALKLEGELDSWPLSTPRDRGRARLWMWSGIGYAERGGDNREEDLERAIAAFTRAAAVFTRETYPEEWTGVQEQLGLAYQSRIRGDRADNLDKAIAYYEATLAVRTREAFPAAWAFTQNNLGAVYWSRIRGDRADNLEKAIGYFEAALTVRTREAFPAEWALTQTNLGATYLDRIHGDRADNLEKTIALYEAALTVRTREAMPQEWAVTQHNLAIAYENRFHGSRTENLERAIALYDAALTVRTREALPQDWATTQHSLGILYANRVLGDRADNLERAIEHLEAALSVRTPAAQPREWADAQHNLALTFGMRLRGERADNLERAIAALEAALTILNRESFPREWTDAQSSLALLYIYRIRGERAENLEQAIVHLESALEILTREGFPAEWAQAQLNLGFAYQERRVGNRTDNLDRAIGHFEAALAAMTPESNRRGWALAKMALGNAYLGRPGASAEAAIASFEAVLGAFNREEFPLEWAIANSALGGAWLDSTGGDRQAVLAKAIGHLEASLSVRRQIAPRDALRLMRQLGGALSEKGEWQGAASAYAEARETFLLLSAQGLDDTAAAALIGEAGPLFSEAAYAAAHLGETEKALALANEGRARVMAAALKLQALDLPADTRRRVDELRAEIRAAERTVEGQATQGAERAAAVEGLVGLRQELMGLIKDADTAEAKVRGSALAQARALAGEGALAVPIVTRLGAKILVVGGRGVRPSGDTANRTGRSAPATRAETKAGATVSDPEGLTPIDLPDLTTARLNTLVAGDDKSGGWLQAYAINLIPDDSEVDRRWPEWMAAIDGLGPDLWRMIGGRLDAALRRAGVKTGARLVWLPTGALGILPLGLAQDPGGKRRLLDRYEIVYAPSLDALTAARAKIAKSVPATLAAVINPTGDLPAAEPEGGLVASLFPATARAVLEGPAATPEEVLVALKGRSYWHFASHGTFVWGNARQSGLLLRDLQRLSIGRLLETGGLGRPRLVVLSACETGLHDIARNPDEFIGLPGTFTALGAAGVLGTLWPVNDTATALLVAKFYDLHLVGRLAPPTTLREAQLWLRRATNADLVAYATGAARQGRIDRTQVATIAEELSADGLRRARNRALVEWIGPGAPTGAGKPASPRASVLARPYAHPYYWAGFIYTGL